MREDILERKDEILSWVEQQQSKAYISKELKCKPLTLDSYLIKMQIEYKGNKGGKGIKLDPKRKSAEEYSKATFVSSHKLRNKLIQDKVKEAKCEECNLYEWNNKPIPLELHHVDGNRFNNLFPNLKILCPNCHAQTDNYGSKNIK
jgi:hypothetical protein